MWDRFSLSYPYLCETKLSLVDANLSSVSFYLFFFCVCVCVCVSLITLSSLWSYQPLYQSWCNQKMKEKKKTLIFCENLFNTDPPRPPSLKKGHFEDVPRDEMLWLTSTSSSQHGTFFAFCSSLVKERPGK